MKIELESGITDEKERDEFESLYFDTLAKAESYIERIESKQQTSNLSRSSSGSNSTVEASGVDDIKLPPINLPTFNGCYDKWLLFCDSFEAIIHKNARLSDVRKFQYLQSALTGEPLNVIKALEISNENYAIAWELLRKRYHNTKLMIHTHLKAIFDIPDVTKETYTGLRNLTDSVQKHLRALEILKQPIHSWDILIIYIMTRKLDYSTNKEWETLVSQKKESVMPTFDEFIDFLDQRCRLLEVIQKNTTDKVKSADTHAKHSTKPNNYGKSTSFVTTVDECELCNQNHKIYTCRKFLAMSVPERISHVKQAKRCFNCLRKDHFTSNCQGGNCKICDKKHASLIHLDKVNLDGNKHTMQHSNQLLSQTGNANAENQNSGNHTKLLTKQPSNQSQSTENQPRTESTHSVSCHSIDGSHTQVLLSTARVMIPDKRGKELYFRVLLDSASQSNFITKQACKELGLKTKSISHSVTGFGNCSSFITEEAEVTIYSTVSQFQTTLKVLVVAKITDNLPLCSISNSSFKIPHNVILADPKFYESSKIDLLVGAEVFYELLCSGQIKEFKSGPIFKETTLGWVVSGRLSGEQKSRTEHSVCNLTLEKQIELFWKIEDVAEKRKWSKEEEECEQHFVDNYKRQLNGQFTVKLPFNTNKDKIGDSKTTALKRFLNQEQRLIKTKGLYGQYCDFMSEYQALGHMTQIKDIPATHYFLPHHAVVKQNSLTTKLRVVFDGSATSSTGVSLNQTLKKGPFIQDELFQILLRFRFHNIVLTADIAKMYRQIRIDDDDANFQLILWREDLSEEISIFKLNTVTYGTTTAPFLAVRCLKQIAVDGAVNQAKASEILASDFYVDDLLTGFSSEEEAFLIAKDLTHLLNSGHFELRKWRSNSQKVISQLKEEFSTFNSSNDILTLDSDTAIKTLGLFWNSVKDTFEYTIEQPESNQTVSKRIILSNIAKIYDPLGLLGPIITTAKLVMQDIWKSDTPWDAPVEQKIHNKWTIFIRDLCTLKELHIPRKISDFQEYEKLEIHGFCDASQSAYGACIYIRTTNRNGDHSVHLLCSKSRVAPLKTISLPRLELCGAVLLSQLLQKVQSSLRTSPDQVTLWTDSTIALAWISMSPTVCKTFICNRISEIQKLTSIKMWRHVAGSQNPADLISRSKYPSDIVYNSIWWNGPSWLMQDENLWPQRSLNSESYDEEILERKKDATYTWSTTIESCIFQKYSNFSKLQRITAWCLRFLNNTQNKNQKLIGSLSVNELNTSTTCLVKLAQHSTYLKEINAIKLGNSLSSTSKLLTLHPFLDEDFTLRVGERLKHANINARQKHPFILPTKHLLTALIIRHEHEKQLHAGTQSTLYNLRLRYWIPSGKNVVKKIIRECIRCFRASPRLMSQQMGNLPAARIQEARPFESSGVDFGGPMLIRESHRRGRIHINKCYIAVFVCFVTKAIHIELVSDLTTNAFLAALRRFTARRGHCKHIYSDNATNFHGAKNELEKFMSCQQNMNLITTNLTNKQISWHFIPARSPHFGGLWESAIKSVKLHIKKVIGNTLLTFEEYYTILTQIEQCLNSRPLTPISNDITDLTALTPNHFLVGDSFTGYEDPDLSHIQNCKLTRWQHLQKMKQDIFKRWKKEYLSSLQVRNKWNRETTNIKIGDLVLINEPSTSNGPLGRIVEVHPGSDNLVRVVTVKVQTSTVKRAITQIAKLPD